LGPGGGVRLSAGGGLVQRLKKKPFRKEKHHGNKDEMDGFFLQEEVKQKQSIYTFIREFESNTQSFSYMRRMISKRKFSLNIQKKKRTLSSREKNKQKKNKQNPLGQKRVGTTRGEGHPKLMGNVAKDKKVFRTGAGASKERSQLLQQWYVRNQKLTRRTGGSWFSEINPEASSCTRGIKVLSKKGLGQLFGGESSVSGGKGGTGNHPVRKRPEIPHRTRGRRGENGKKKKIAHQCRGKNPQNSGKNCEKTLSTGEKKRKGGFPKN